MFTRKRFLYVYRGNIYSLRRYNRIISSVDVTTVPSDVISQNLFCFLSNVKNRHKFTLLDSFWSYICQIWKMLCSLLLMVKSVHKCASASVNQKKLNSFHNFRPSVLKHAQHINILNIYHTPYCVLRNLFYLYDFFNKKGIIIKAYLLKRNF